MAKIQRHTGNRTQVKVLASAISAILGAGATHSAHGQEVPDDEVLVTGSRIVRRDLDAPTPIMTVDTQRLENSSTLSVESILNQMPQFTPAQSQFSAQGEIQTSPVGSLGVGTLNLRGVSTNRTLVLIDGRRAQPVNASLVVDVNTLPSAAIERVETITGGASAVYGADALAGVVNFVLKDNFEGISVDAQTGISAAGDGEETRFSALLGMNSDSGNSNMLLGVEWYEREASFQKERDFYVDGWHDPTNPAGTFFPSMAGYAVDALDLSAVGGNSPNRPSQAVIDSLFPQLPAGTVNVATPGLTFYANKNNTLYARSATGQTWGFDDTQLDLPDTGDGRYGLIRNANGTLQQIFMDGALSSPLTRRSAFGKAHVDIDDNLRAFVQANFTRTEVQTFSAGPPPAVGAAWGGSIPNNLASPNTQIPSALQTLLNSRTRLGPDPDGAGPLTRPVIAGSAENWQLNRGLDFLGQFGPFNSSDVYQIVAGLEGSFTNRDWTWEAYYSSGSTNAVNIYYGLPSLQRWLRLVSAPNFGLNANIPSAQGGNYAMTCTSGLPIFFGTTATMSQDCVESVIGRFKSETIITQDILEGYVQGTILEMGAGDLQFAAGLSNRRNDFKYEPSNPESSIFDYPLGLFVSNATAGSTEVSEIYGEVIVPIVDRLDLELGYRYSDYDSAAGSVGTYKALFDWGATDWMRLRGGYQQANRAPNTAELFQAETTIFEFTFSSGDPCGVNTNAAWGNRPSNPMRLQVQQLCAALIGNNTSNFGAPGSAQANTFLAGAAPFTGINGVQRGNPNLLTEEAQTWTVGLVFQSPGRFEGLSASIDLYNIEITDAISTFNGFTIYGKCFNFDGVSNPTYSINDPGGFCQLINRDAGTGGAGTVEELYLNTGIIDTAGIDIQANWTKELAGGSFYMNHLVSYLDKFNTQTAAIDPVLEYKGTLGNSGQYDYRLNSTFGYQFGGGNASVGLRWRYLPEVKNAAFVTDRNTTIFPTESYSVFDLFAGYTFAGRYHLRGGIDNLLDTDPAVVGALPGDSNSASTIPGYYDTLGRRLFVGLKIEF
jgi:iron complex outermembrane receptor protein